LRGSVRSSLPAVPADQPRLWRRRLSFVGSPFPLWGDVRHSALSKGRHHIPQLAIGSPH
jgi:hypothetical protein